jgi:hypothetical protein
MNCPVCAATAEDANYCSNCGTSLLGVSPPPPGYSSRPTSSSGHLREAGANLSAAAAPFVGKLAQKLEAASSSATPTTDFGAEAGSWPEPPPPTPGGRHARLPTEQPYAAGHRPVSERIGRGVGDTVGYGIRGVAGTALAPAREAWSTREQLPPWQIWMGAAGLVLNFASVAGVVLIALIYVALIVSGGHGPGQAFRRLLRVFSYVLLVEIGVCVVVLLGILIANG